MEYPDHQHHWLISKTKPIGKGTCHGCGEIRYFVNLGPWRGDNVSIVWLDAVQKAKFDNLVRDMEGV